MRHAVPAVVILACAAVSSLVGPSAVNGTTGTCRAAWAGPSRKAASATATAATTTVAIPDGFGPGLGNVRYRGELRYGPDGYDTDEFSSRLAKGERLSVRIVSPFQSPLFPKLEILGPDGVARPADVVSRGFGKRLEIANFTVPETGRWTVRVGSILQTQGKYAITFGVRSAPPTRIDVGPDGSGEAPTSADLLFDAVEGSTLSLRANGAGRSRVAIAALVDPAGADVVGDEGLAVLSASAKSGVLALHVASLGRGDGTYRATLTAAAGHDGFSAVARVVPPARPRGTRHLTAAEPWIEPIARPIRGVHERAVRIHGLHLAAHPAPTVLFGGVPGTEASVEPYGTYIDVAPPILPENGVYPVEVVLADGQASRRADYLYYVPTPRADAFVDQAGSVVVGGATEGGRVVRLVGANFQTGIFLKFGGSKDVLPLILGDGLIEVVTPPHAAGIVDVRIYDAYLHDVLVAVPYEYKDPPSLSFAPFTPSVVVADVPTPMVLAGDNFSRSDFVLFDGQPVTTAWISDSRITFTVPPSPAGPHTIAVVDRLGTLVMAPTLVVQ